MTRHDLTAEVSPILALPTVDAATVALEGLLAAGYAVQGQAGAGPVGQVVDAYKRYIEPYLVHSRDAADSLWQRCLGATKLEHPESPEDLILVSAAVDFVREVVSAIGEEGGFEAQDMTFHALAAFCVVVARAVSSVPWRRP
ncbi:MAG: hypothetical protein IT349_09075 [Candidatus Eisenbacteria bacterium]|nr:hypothetical protein [Candidatus Eisenbacteria bacterium]